jgi:hypothetical protein
MSNVIISTTFIFMIQSLSISAYSRHANVKIRALKVVV